LLEFILVHEKPKKGFNQGDNLLLDLHFPHQNFAHPMLGIQRYQRARQPLISEEFAGDIKKI
jgi:hypothetical protein